jgi:hypothetical protein
MKIRIATLALPAFLLPSLFCAALGQTVAPSDPSNAGFGTQKIGKSSSPVGYNITNPETSAVKFTVQATPADYQIEKNSCTGNVAAKATCVVYVTFSPVAEGSRPGQLSVSYPAVAGGSTARSLPPIPLIGNGKLPDLVVSASRVYFAPQEAGTASAPQTITLTNHSTSDLTITSVAATGDFSFEGFHDSKALKQGETLVLVVRFKPSREAESEGMLTILSSAEDSPQDVYLSGSTRNALSDLCAASPRAELAVVFVVFLLYWLAVVVVRWNRIARPTREFLKAELDSLQSELETAANGKQGDDEFRAGKIKGLIATARNLIDNPNDPWFRRAANVLFWSRGQEMTGWGYVYEAQIQMVALLSPQTVVARLESNEQQLRVVGDAPSLAMANAIHTQLTAVGADVDPDRRKALLAEAFNANFDRDEKEFAGLVSWQNKASWLVGCGLVLILMLTGVIHHHSILFLVGATGGLLSRLSRSLERKDVPSDYGASWTTLFLSPVAGALGAWAGILISGLAVQLNVLGSVFNVDWSTAPCEPTTLAIALAFGFSERLLDGVFDQLVGKTGVAQTTSTNPQPPPKTTSAPPAGQAADQSAKK